MAQLILNDIDQETAEKLEQRAKRLGTTPEEEASRLLRERLRAEPDRDVSATGTDEAGLDPRFVRSHGFLIFTGAVATEEIVPTHLAEDSPRSDQGYPGPIRGGATHSADLSRSPGSLHNQGAPLGSNF